MNFVDDVVVERVVGLAPAVGQVHLLQAHVLHLALLPVEQFRESIDSGGMERSLPARLPA